MANVKSPVPPTSIYFDPTLKAAMTKRAKSQGIALGTYVKRLIYADLFKDAA